MASRVAVGDEQFDSSADVVAPEGGLDVPHGCDGNVVDSEPPVAGDDARDRELAASPWTLQFEPLTGVGAITVRESERCHGPR